jgi:L-glyceraldehyde 3-phosphate reductase
VIHQPVYNMFNRWVEPELLGTLEQEGIGCIVFSPLAQGLLTSRYLQGIPSDSRAASGVGFLRPEHVTEQRVAAARALNRVAEARGQSLAQLALAWVLRHPTMTSVLIGASKVQQLDDNVGALDNLAFSEDELAQIETILADAK